MAMTPQNEQSTGLCPSAGADAHRSPQKTGFSVIAVTWSTGLEPVSLDLPSI